MAALPPSQTSDAPLGFGPAVGAPAFMRGSSALQAERHSVVSPPFVPFAARGFCRAAKGAGPVFVDFRVRGARLLGGVKRAIPQIFT
jgi:hypothetical protein